MLVRFSTPRSWYLRASRPSRWLWLLHPLSLVWAGLTQRRIRRIKPKDIGIPVICVGNLTLGGSGKTPVVAALLQLLAQTQDKAFALTKGYGGRSHGPLLVDPAYHRVEEVGDEALMLASHHPVIMAKDRLAGGEFAKTLGAGVIVMDDGHQNPYLKKQLSLIVVDGDTRDGAWPFGNEAIFPKGPLRETFQQGLERADAVILILPKGVDRPDRDLVNRLAIRPVFIARIRPQGSLPSGPLIGFAGIAKPWKFEDSLKSTGADLVDFISYPDHMEFQTSDLQRLETIATAKGAKLITTQKDFVRLPKGFQAKTAVASIGLEFEEAEKFEDLITEALKTLG